jgi:Flp pilus assembly pilin Flp
MQRTLAAVGNLFLRLVRDESGGESLEYALIGGAVVAVSYASIESVGRKVTALWQSLDYALSAVSR